MSGVSGGGGGRGRGRGRGRATEPGQAATLPGGAGTPRQESGGEVGRRAAVGRRGGEGASTTPPEKPARGSPPGSDHSPSSLTEKMASTDLISLTPRPGFGTLGRKYRMFTNHFEVGFASKVLTVNRYHVEVSHPRVKLTRDDNRPIFWKCLLDNKNELGLTGVDAHHKVMYDGMHTCFTLDPLNIPFDKENDHKKFTIETIVSKCDRPMTIEILIQSTGPILVDLAQVTASNLSERSTTPVQVIDILLRQYRSCTFSDIASLFYPFRNSIYMIPGGSSPGGVDLGGGREVWKGLFTSAHVAQNNRLLVNMDVDHTAFYKFASRNGNANGGKYSVIQFLCDVLNETEGKGRIIYDPSQLRPDTVLPETQRKMFEREIKGLRVCLNYKRANTKNEEREYRVNAVDRSAADCIFTNRDNVQQSVADYFAQTYGPLRYPKIFTLKVGPVKRSINLPIEHCYLAKNQKVMKKLTENQTSTMIRQTCMAPQFRKTAIEEMVKSSRFDEDPFLRNFGVRLNPQMIGVEGRVLNPPSISYGGGGQPMQPRDGVWRAQNVRFHIPAGASGIAAVAFQRAPQRADDFVGQLIERCRQSGMQMPNNKDIYFHLEHNSSPQRVEIAFRSVLERMKHCQLIIVFLPVKGGSLYADVKRVGEIQLGIMTQCVVNKTVERSSPETLMNIAFKINMKLGGVNCALSAREQAAKYLINVPTLVLGIDVTHPGPTEKKKPSVASVVGSMDLTQMRYGASIKVQQQRDEHLVYLSEKVKERLVAFYKATEVKPDRIIIYRDGVSEGQFQQVLREELRGVREACLRIDSNYKPKITFVVVQKRHHTRFFPADQNDACGKHKNVHPGSVVDNTIVHQDEFVFYLCSHAGIQGTSRPTRYYVLHDDSNFTADDMQMITYYLCHCFSRCARAVSIPAPVYFADLACTRARAHLAASLGDAWSDTTSTHSGEGGSSSTPNEDELIAATTVTDEIRKQMYFT